MSNNPYAHYVEGRDPLASLEETSRRIETMVRGWTPEMFERRHAPGKWSARQLLIHLVHAEMVFGERVRFALTKPDYVVVPFDQDEWMRVEGGAVEATAALGAYLALRRQNLAFFRSLTPAQRGRRLRHPERGEIDVNWIVTALAGHDRHHLPQLEAVAAAAAV